MRLLKPLSLAALVAVPVLGATLTTSCVENKSSVYIHSALAIPGDCKVTTGPDEATISYGEMDVAFQSGYTVALLIGNQLTPLAEQDSLRTETARFAIKGYEVHVMSGNLASELTAFTSVASGTISPGESDPGFGGLFALVIPPGLDLEPNSLYVANVRVFGETLGGVELETAEFEFPVVTKPLNYFAVGLVDGVCDPTADIGDTAFSCYAGQGPTPCGQLPK